VLGECGAVDGVRIRREIDVLEENRTNATLSTTEARIISETQAEVFSNRKEYNSNATDLVLFPSDSELANGNFRCSLAG
jgi:hypothetical protein